RFSRDWSSDVCSSDLKKVLAPEYGGNGRTIGRCAEARDPLVALPAHWGPNALLFYSGTGPAAFPAEYRGGAFIAFHGSWNRAPYIGRASCRRRGPVAG